MTAAGNIISIDSARVPYLDQYVGLWLMNEAHFWAKYQLIQQMNISLHVAQAADKAAAAGDGGKRRTPGGYGYTLSDAGIAIVELRGSLMKQQTSADDSTSTVMIRRDARALANDPAVKGVMFVHDSPGGTVAGAYELADDIAALAAAKPTGSFIDGLSASADYLQAAMTGFISAFRTAEVGSIGTRMVVVDSSGMAAQKGLKVYAIDSGGMKSAGQPGTEITAEQLAYFQGIIDDAQQHFVEAVSRGRNVGIARARELSDGRIHSAAKARQLGLVDHVESFDQAMQRLQALAASGGGIRSRSTATARAGAATMSTPPAGAEELDDMPATNDPKPATIAELEAAFPGAQNASFIIRAAKLAWSLDEAKSAHELITDQVAAAKNGGSSGPRRPGVQPIESAGPRRASEEGDAGDDDDPVAAFGAAVAAEMKKPGCRDRHHAVTRVSKSNRELHRQYLLATNPPSQHAKIEDRFADLQRSQPRR